MVSTSTLITSTILLLSATLSSASPASSSSSTISAATPTSTSITPTCAPEHEGIIYPTAGTTITLVKNDNLDPTIVEIIYCSGAYFKISTIEASALLSFTDPIATAGQMLVKDAKPDNLDAAEGFSSYRFNASIYPSDGSYYNGNMAISVFETTTGESLQHPF
jgi:hypothetical protein